MYNLKKIRFLFIVNCIIILSIQNFYAVEPSDNTSNAEKKSEINQTYWPVSASWNGGLSGETICSGGCLTMQATGSGSHDPPMSITYTGPGTPPPNPNSTGIEPAFTVCPSVTTTYTVTVSDTYTGSPPFTASFTVTVSNCGCDISSLTADTTSCDPATNTYDLSGIVTFSTPPTTGILTVSDCNGNNQTFNPPFVSPINYNINGINANGSACSVTAVFSDSLVCTLSTNYNSPISCIPPVCTMTLLEVNDSICIPETNEYDVNGTLAFTTPPTTGILTVSDCHGNTQSFSPPFISPINYSISGINADGNACDVTAVFSDDPACSIVSNYLAPESCVLDIVIPNIITPNGDNFNDFLAFKNLEFFPNQIKIFNRWGILVYEKKNYENDWNGDELSEGAYFFILEVTLPNIGSQIYKKTFTLFR